MRVEVWKGFEYRPPVVRARASRRARRRARDARARAGRRHGQARLRLGRPAPPLPARDRRRRRRSIFDLLEAEDIRYGSILAYNEPAGPYTGDSRDAWTPPAPRAGARRPSAGGATTRSSRARSIGARTYGHLNLFLRDDLVRRRAERQRQQLARSTACSGARRAGTGGLRHLRPRRLRPGDLRRLRAGRR